MRRARSSRRAADSRARVATDDGSPAARAGAVRVHRHDNSTFSYQRAWPRAFRRASGVCLHDASTSPIDVLPARLGSSGGRRQFRGDLVVRPAFGVLERAACCRERVIDALARLPQPKVYLHRQRIQADAGEDGVLPAPRRGAAGVAEPVAGGARALSSDGLAARSPAFRTPASIPSCSRRRSLPQERPIDLGLPRRRRAAVSRAIASGARSPSSSSARAAPTA